MHSKQVAFCWSFSGSFFLPSVRTERAAPNQSVEPEYSELSPFFVFAGCAIKSTAHFVSRAQASQDAMKFRTCPRSFSLHAKAPASGSTINSRALAASSRTRSPRGVNSPIVEVWRDPFESGDHSGPSAAKSRKTNRSSNRLGNVFGVVAACLGPIA